MSANIPAPMIATKEASSSPTRTIVAGRPTKRYLLRSPFIGERFEHALTKEEFESLHSARSFLSEYMSFEESVLQVLYACEEFEAFLLNTGLNHYLFPLHEHDFMQDTRLRANLKVLGFLNSVTSLRDQFPGFKKLSGPFEIRSRFRQLWDDQKQASVAFAFCERFRNYAQHQTQPVSSVTLGGGWDKDRSLMESHVSVFVTIDSVCANRDIEEPERQRYEAAFGTKCEISLVFRETMACIGQIVKEIRAALESNFISEIAVYDHGLATAESHRENFVVAEAIAIVDDVEVEQVQIFSDFSKRAKRLRATFVMTNNQAHFISNKARGHAQ